jgi:putative peptidoglycan lipid II flippase
VFGSFAAPAATPALLNVAMIAGALALAPKVSRPESALAWAVLAGGSAQILFLFSCLARRGVVLRRAAPMASPALKRAVRLMLPVGLGSAVYQINVLVGGLLASFLPEGSVSCLYYAERLVEFPLGVVAAAGATAVLPSLAREAVIGDRQALAATMGYAVRMTAFITLPATAGLLLLAEPLVALLFQRGAFGADSVRLTSQAVSYYAVGLMGVAAARIVAAVFFAGQESRAPLGAAIASMAANLLLGAALMGPMGSAGIALACALSAWVNLGLLLAAVRSRVKGLDGRAMGASLARSSGATLLMAASLHLWTGTGWLGHLPEAVALGMNVALGVLFFVVFSWAFRSPELSALRRLGQGDRIAR